MVAFPRNSPTPLYTIQIIPPYQVRAHVNSIEDVQAAGVCPMQESARCMHNAWHLNDTAGIPLTCLHVHCFDFLAGPPQALELNPLTVRHLL